MLYYKTIALLIPLVIYLLLRFIQTPGPQNVPITYQLGQTSSGAACRVVVPRKKLHCDGQLVLDDLVDEKKAIEKIGDFKKRHMSNETSTDIHDCFHSVDTESWKLETLDVDYTNKEFYTEEFIFRYRKSLFYQPVTAVTIVRQCFRQHNSTVQCEITSSRNELFGLFYINSIEQIVANLSSIISQFAKIIFKFDALLSVLVLIVSLLINFVISESVRGVFNAVTKPIEDFFFKKEKLVNPGPYILRQHHFGVLPIKKVVKLNCNNRFRPISDIYYIRSHVLLKSIVHDMPTV